MEDVPLGSLYLSKDTLTTNERALIFGLADAPREDVAERSILELYRQCSVKEINDKQFKMELAVLLGEEESKRVYQGLLWSLTVREMIQQQAR